MSNNVAEIKGSFPVVAEIEMVTTLEATLQPKITIKSLTDNFFRGCNAAIFQ